MNELTVIFLGLAAGAGLGVVYFGGLWWTTQWITRPGGPRAFILPSFLARLAVCLVGFYLVLNFMGLRGLLSSVFGFMLTQGVFVRRLGKKTG